MKRELSMIVLAAAALLGGAAQLQVVVAVA